MTEGALRTPAGVDLTFAEVSAVVSALMAAMPEGPVRRRLAAGAP